MIIIAYFFTFILSIVFYGLFYIKMNRKYFVIALIGSIIFFAIGILDAKIIENKQIAIMQQEEKRAEEVTSTNENYSNRTNNVSDYLKNQASFEKKRLGAYRWNKTESDIIKSGNILLVKDVLNNVLTGIIQSSNLYEHFSSANYFEKKIRTERNKYIGNYCTILMNIQWRGLCENNEILKAFPQIEGYTLLMDKGTLLGSKSTYIMSLTYMRNNITEAFLKNLQDKEVNNEGIYIGTVEENGIINYVLINYLQGE